MLVDRVDLATRLSLFSRQAAGPSALAPAKRAGAQRLCALAHRVGSGIDRQCRYRRVTGPSREIGKTAADVA
jgi:hypothetical protein